MTIDYIFAKIKDEIKEANKKNGDWYDHSIFECLSKITEEYLEVIKEFNDIHENKENASIDNAKKELIQLACVTIKLLNKLL